MSSRLFWQNNVTKSFVSNNIPSKKKHAMICIQVQNQLSKYRAISVTWIMLQMQLCWISHRRTANPILKFGLYRAVTKLYMWTVAKLFGLWILLNKNFLLKWIVMLKYLDLINLLLFDKNIFIWKKEKYFVAKVFIIRGYRTFLWPVIRPFNLFRPWEMIFKIILVGA